MGSQICLFRLNRGTSFDLFDPQNSCTREICMQNQRNGVETNIYLDNNIISAIRKFVKPTEENKEVDEETKNTVKQIIETLKHLTHIFISPGLAFEEACPNLKKANIEAFETFCKEHIFFGDAYNAIPYTPQEKKQKRYLINMWASIMCMRYVRKKNPHGNSFEKFKTYLELLCANLPFMDAICIHVAMCAFMNPHGLSENYSKIVKNFVTKGKFKEGSLNAAHDVVFMRTIMSANFLNPTPGQPNKIQAWGLTDDRGIFELAKLISSPQELSPFNFCDLTSAAEHTDYFYQCINYQNKLALQRNKYLTLHENFDQEKAIQMADGFMEKMETNSL
ncbi:MAG: hypothetical protein C0514_06345 [Candidatus Puniceispirillum sp.]|nr:hypothetical protein [Candidatus Puniceispirillum sp.]